MPEPRSYPAEPPVDLRAVRKAAPRPVEEPEPLAVDPPDTFTPNEQELGSARPSIPALSSLLPEPDGVGADPARWGFRGWANAATGGLLRLRPKTPEIEARAAYAALRQQWVGHQTVMVANPKGGEGVTIAALMLGNVVADARGGNVVIWDNNETEGTLGVRAISARGSAPTVWDLLGHVEQLANPATPVSAVTRFLRMQPTRAEVLAADESPDGTAQITAEHCRAIYGVLSRLRELVIIDTGNNRRRSNWLWAAYTAHLLVIPMTLREDSAIVVCRMLAALHERGLYSLITNAIVVLTVPPAAVPGKREVILEALQHSGIRNVVEVPYDPGLAGGGRVDHARLADNTVIAWTRVAAMAATSLAVSSQEREPQYADEVVAQSFQRSADTTRGGGRDDGDDTLSWRRQHSIQTLDPARTLRRNVFGGLSGGGHGAAFDTRHSYGA
ncbi:MinD/ParA family ATP-binding protein [Nocardia sp. CA-120079]|uniref:MinD/ParA family ATP-binding protein n=1 Tax=Nocardia sp. CA-120079 TaxID=3239974 RepID=UPI003D97D912